MIHVLFIEDKECYETKLTVSQEKYFRELQKIDIKYLTKAQDKKNRPKNLTCGTLRPFQLSRAAIAKQMIKDFEILKREADNSYHPSNHLTSKSFDLFISRELALQGDLETRLHYLETIFCNLLK